MNKSMQGKNEGMNAILEKLLLRTYSIVITFHSSSLQFKIWLTEIEIINKLAVNTELNLIYFNGIPTPIIAIYSAHAHFKLRSS